MEHEPYEYIAKWNDAGEPLDKESALDFIRNLIHGSLGMKDFIKDGCLYSPDSQLTLRLEIESLMEQGAVVDFHIEAPQWETEIFECCASPGETTKHALGGDCAHGARRVRRDVRDELRGARAPLARDAERRRRRRLHAA